MSRTITAMFDNRSDAEAGLQRLKQANVDASSARIHDQGQAGQSGDADSNSQSDGMWSSVKNAFLPDDDRQTYEEGVRRGGFVLSADVDENQVDEAVAALEQASCVDIDERSQQWRSEGWSPQPSKPAMFGSQNGGDQLARSAGQDHLDVVEEELIVGKREVERGGARVRSYVTEVPVHEQVRLRDERVEIERHPVDRDISSTDRDPFQERTLEMTESHEEAVVGKKAHVTEEIELRKTSDEHVENIDDTVRKTQVDVENLSDTSRSGQQRSGEMQRDNKSDRY